MILSELWLEREIRMFVEDRDHFVAAHRCINISFLNQSVNVLYFIFVYRERSHGRKNNSTQEKAEQEKD